jgi:hypothetical protein
MEEPGLGLSHLDAGDLMPVVILCAISIILSLLWLIGLWRYILSGPGNHAPNSGRAAKKRPTHTSW